MGGIVRVSLATEATKATKPRPIAFSRFGRFGRFGLLSDCIAAFQGSATRSLGFRLDLPLRFEFYAGVANPMWLMAAEQVTLLSEGQTVRTSILYHLQQHVLYGVTGPATEQELDAAVAVLPDGSGRQQVLWLDYVGAIEQGVRDAESKQLCLGAGRHRPNHAGVVPVPVVPLPIGLPSGPNTHYQGVRLTGGTPAAQAARYVPIWAPSVCGRYRPYSLI